MTRSLWKKTTLGLIVATALGLNTPAFAAGDSVTSKTYEELTEIQEIMTSDPASATARLETLLADVEADSLDQALVLQTLGYAEMGNEDFPAAIDYLKRSLATERLPQQVVYNVGYMVAQLHAAQGEFDQALEFAEGWFAQLEAPTPDQMIFMANIFAQTKNYEKSVPYAKQAIAASDDPRESWYQLLTANYFELKAFPDAATTLQAMVARWTDNGSYWEQLASVYVVMEDQARALATLRIAYEAGYIEKESTVKSMIQLSVMEGIPEHGARMLEAALYTELVPEDEDYLEMLAQAWANAREYDQAVAAYERMAAIVDSGDPWMKIANIYVEDANWAEAERAVNQALEMDLESPGKAWLLLGIAQSEQGKFTSARTSLRKAAAFEDTERSATSWIRYAEDMKRQADWLAANQ